MNICTLTNSHVCMHNNEEKKSLIMHAEIEKYLLLKGKTKYAH